MYIHTIKYLIIYKALKQRDLADKGDDFFHLEVSLDSSRQAACVDLQMRH